MTDTEFRRIAEALLQGPGIIEEPEDQPITMAGGSVTIHSPKKWKDGALVYSSTQFVSGVNFAADGEDNLDFTSLVAALDIKINLVKGGKERRILLTTDPNRKQLQFKFQRRASPTHPWVLVGPHLGRHYLNCGALPHKFEIVSVEFVSPEIDVSAVTDFSECFLQIVFSLR